MSALADLIARVEGATEGGSKLDRALAETIGGWHFSNERGCWMDGDQIPRGAWPHYSRSLDAALGLAGRVLPGWSVQATSHPPTTPYHRADASVWPMPFDDDSPPFNGIAATPALALVLAILKAKAGEEG